MRRPVPHAWTGTGFDRALLAHDRGTDQPNRAYEERTHAGDDTIREAEIGRTPPGAIQDQDLVLEEYGFGNHGPRVAGTSQPGDRRQQMQKQDGEITHRTIGSRSRLRQKRSRILQFATHTLPFTRLADPDASGCDVALERVDGELLLIDDRPDDVADRDDSHQPTLL
jgi:hypothetical protein